MLDYDDELLARFDVVVASVHVSRRQPRAELTRRTLNAIRSPHVDIVAHPSGRMIQTRDDLDLDWDAVYAAAAADRDGARDERLAAPPRPVGRAGPPGGRGGLHPDDRLGRPQHRELDYVRWGVSQARRAWVEAATVLNTRSRADLLAWVGGQARAAGRLRDRGRVPRSGRRPRYHPRRDPYARPRGRGRPARPDARSSSSIVGLARLLDGPLVVARRRSCCSPRRCSARSRSSGQVEGPAAEHGVPIETLILPAVAAIGCLGAIDLVPIGIWLVPALAATAFLVDRTLAPRGADRRDATGT